MIFLGFSSQNSRWDAMVSHLTLPIVGGIAPSCSFQWSVSIKLEIPTEHAIRSIPGGSLLPFLSTALTLLKAYSLISSPFQHVG